VADGAARPPRSQGSEARKCVGVQSGWLIHGVDAVSGVRDAMVALEVACDGGKDSLSMAATAGGEVVMAPGNLVGYRCSYTACRVGHAIPVLQVVAPARHAPCNLLRWTDR
jgi:hypothetical protein